MNTEQSESRKQQEYLESIAKSLREVACWLRFSVLQTDDFRDKSRGEQSLLLKNAGLDNKLISEILGISEDAVRARLSYERRKIAKEE